LLGKQCTIKSWDQTPTQAVRKPKSGIPLWKRDSGAILHDIAGSLQRMVGSRQSGIPQNIGNLVQSSKKDNWNSCPDGVN
jgi:hypothetical protein